MGKYITMKTKKSLLNLKKIPYNLALILLTAGASTILGFLSFSGMLALVPIVPLAITALVLSVAYEGEIYLQNIKGAINKLFKNNYLKNKLAREFLLEHFPPDLNAQDCPQFFKDYAQQLLQLKKVTQHKSTSEHKQQKKYIKKRLNDMEKWFALCLFPGQESTDNSSSIYTQELTAWLAQNGQLTWQARLDQRRTTFHRAAAFSSLSALFMGLGSTYLMVEAFSAIPWFAAIPFTFWPLVIVPMAMIAGAAYGLLTYNTITDFINDDTINKWFTKLSTNFKKEGFSWRNIIMASTSLLLIGLAVALTICTAGTWWTIATNARPLFEWMRQIPSFVMGVINPIVTGISAIFFNIQNTAESIEQLDEALQDDGPTVKEQYISLKKKWNELCATENSLQIINPFRLLKVLIMTPLRFILFLGHLLSIAFTADRMPGIPQIWAALIAFISEGFEDAHYFTGHSHKSPKDDGILDDEHPDLNLIASKLLKARLETGHGHSHEQDIPTKILYALATPLDILATGWDALARKLIRQPANPNTAITANPTEEIKSGVFFDKLEPSTDWQKEHAVALIEKHIQKHLRKATVNSTIAEQKIAALQRIQQQIRQSDGADLSVLLPQVKTSNILNKHRFFASTNENTNTQYFIEELPQRVLPG